MLPPEKSDISAPDHESFEDEGESSNFDQPMDLSLGQKSLEANEDDLNSTRSNSRCSETMNTPMISVKKELQITPPSVLQNGTDTGSKNSPWQPPAPPQKRSFEDIENGDSSVTPDRRSFLASTSDTVSDGSPCLKKARYLEIGNCVERDKGHSLPINLSPVSKVRSIEINVENTNELLNESVLPNNSRCSSSHFTSVPEMDPIRKFHENLTNLSLEKYLKELTKPSLLSNQNATEAQSSIPYYLSNRSTGSVDHHLKSFSDNSEKLTGMPQRVERPNSGGVNVQHSEPVSDDINNWIRAMISKNLTENNRHEQELQYYRNLAQPGPSTSGDVRRDVYNTQSSHHQSYNMQENWNKMLYANLIWQNIINKQNSNVDIEGNRNTHLLQEPSNTYEFLSHKKPNYIFQHEETLRNLGKEKPSNSLTDFRDSLATSYHERDATAKLPTLDHSNLTPFHLPAYSSAVLQSQLNNTLLAPYLAPYGVDLRSEHLQNQVPKLSPQPSTSYPSSRKLVSPRKRHFLPGGSGHSPMKQQRKSPKSLHRHLNSEIALSENINLTNDSRVNLKYNRSQHSNAVEHLGKLQEQNLLDMRIYANNLAHASKYGPYSEEILKMLSGIPQNPSEEVKEKQSRNIISDTPKSFNMINIHNFNNIGNDLYSFRNHPRTDDDTLVTSNSQNATNSTSCDTEAGSNQKNIINNLLESNSSSSAGQHANQSLNIDMGSGSSSSSSSVSAAFATSIPDDKDSQLGTVKKKATRALTGRHVRSGTGASLNTLNTLRETIKRRKSQDQLANSTPSTSRTSSAASGSRLRGRKRHLPF